MWRRFQSVMVVVFLVIFVAEGWRAITGPWFSRWHAAADAVFAIYWAAYILHEKTKESRPENIVQEILAVGCIGLFVFVVAAFKFS
jgi:hypothetical protein